MNLFEFQLLKHSATGQSFSGDSLDFQAALHDLAGGFLVLIERVGVDNLELNVYGNIDASMLVSGVRIDFLVS